MFSLRKILTAAAGVLILASGVSLSAPPALAACAPGIPCIVNKTTPNPNTGPNAPKLDGSTTCDADMMNQIYSKAFLEATRQNIMNEVLIRKPDSILEYTCFNAHADDAAPKLGSIFSETTRWQNYTVPINGEIYTRPNYAPVPFVNVTIDVNMGPRLQTKIQNLVLTSVSAYIGSQFGHSFLGGSGGIDYAAGTLPCTNMDDVYFLSKCKDFATDDQFLSFQALTSLDPRQLPAACTGGTKITQPLIDLAANLNDNYASIEPDNQTHRNYLDPSPCLNPIPTGVMIQTSQKTVNIFGGVSATPKPPYPDMICPNPSCYLDTTTSPARCRP